MKRKSSFVGIGKQIEQVEAIVEAAINPATLPYPWCPRRFQSQCAIDGMCRKQFEPNGSNCGE